MKSFSITFAIMMMGQIALMATPSYAIVGADMTRATLRQEFGTDTHSIRISGNLTCEMAETNDGQACDLKIRDSKTGRTYLLGNAQSVMKLYQEGTKTVAIEGTIDGSMIDVSNVTASKTTAKN